MLGITNNMDRTEVTVVGYFNGKSDLYDEYVVAANEMRGTFKFMHSFDPDVAKAFDVPQESVVVYMPEIFWTQYENKTHVLTKKISHLQRNHQFHQDKFCSSGRMEKQKKRVQIPRKTSDCYLL